MLQMKEKNNSEISFNDPVFSPLILFSLENYLKRTRESGTQSKTIYNFTLQTLEKLDFFPPDESDPSSFTIGVHIYNPIYENSIKQLEEQGLVEREDKKLLLTEDGFKVLKLLISQFKTTTSFDILKFIEEEIDGFNENLTIQSKIIMKGHKEIIALIRQIGSQIHQYSPNYPKLTSYQKKLLYWLYKLGEIQKWKMIELCQSGAPLEGHNWKSLYDSFDRLKDKGLVIKTKKRKEIIKYTLSKVGKDKAKSYVDNYNEL
jgi:hypothetical protein